MKKNKKIIVISIISCLLMMWALIGCFMKKDNNTINTNQAKKSLVFYKIEGQNDKLQIDDCFIILQGGYAYLSIGNIKRHEDFDNKEVEDFSINLVLSINNQEQTIVSYGSEIYNFELSKEEKQINSIYGVANPFITKLYNDNTKLNAKLLVTYKINGKIIKDEVFTKIQNLLKK